MFDLLPQVELAKAGDEDGAHEHGWHERGDEHEQAVAAHGPGPAKQELLRLAAVRWQRWLEQVGQRPPEPAGGFDLEPVNERGNKAQHREAGCHEPAHDAALRLRGAEGEAVRRERFKLGAQARWCPR